jgi:hypothetical protein
MALFRIRPGGRRVAAVDGYAFPAGLRQRFALQHPELSDDGFRSVEAAARQWFRLGARRPRARLAMPSVIVGDFCRELLLHTREVVPERPVRPAGDGPRELLATYRFAQQDEPVVPGQLPALFRVDQEVAVEGGLRYLADCGGRGVCYELKGLVCLQHLGGAGKAPDGRKWDFKRADHEDGGGYGGSDFGISGCGAGY